MSHMITLVSDELAAQERALSTRRNMAKQFPPGYLIQQDAKESSRFYWVEPSKNKDKKKLYHRLYEKDYLFMKCIRDKFLLDRQCKAYENNISCMKNFLSNYIPCDEETLLRDFREPYKSLGGFSPPPKDHHMPCQSENPFKRHHLIHRNSVGELFRSKSEVHISELLLTNKIPYRYEQKLTIDGETKYPDFTIHLPESGKQKFIEYFGMIDKDEYGETLAERITWYLNRHLLQGRDVLFLFETQKSGIDLVFIWEQIKDFLAI